MLARAHHGSVSQRAAGQQIEEDLKAGRLPAVVATSSPRARHRHGRRRPRRPGRVAARRWRPGCSASDAPATRWAPCRAACSSRSSAATWCRPPSSSSACAPGAIEALRVPANPLDVLAQQIVAMVALDDWTVDDARGARPPRGAVRRRSPAACSSRCSTCSPGATRPTSSPSCVRASSGTASPTPSPDAAARSGSPSPRAAPSPTAACSASSSPARGPAAGSASSTRRWSTSRGSATSSRSAPRTWRIEDITHDRVLVTPGPRPARPAAVLEGRHPRAGPPSSGAAVGAFVREVAGARAGRRARAGARRRARRVGGRQPARLPGRAARGDRTRARRPHDRRRALPRRARRLARRRALPVRRAGARAVGAGGRRPAARALRRRRAGDARRRRHRVAAARHRAGRGRAGGGAAGRGRRRQLAELLELIFLDPDEVAALVTERDRRLGAVRLPVPRVRRHARCCCPGAVPTSGSRCGSSASGPRSCSRWRSQYPSFPIVLEAVRECLQDVFDVPGLVELLRDVRSRARSRPSRSRRTTAVAVRPVAAVRLRRAVPLRGRLPAGRAAGGRADARPDLLAELLGTTEGSRCATCSTPTRSPAPRRSCSTSPSPAGRATPTSVDRPAARARAAVRRRSSTARSRPAPTSSDGWLAELAQRPARDRAHAVAGESALGRDRGRRPPARRPRRRRCRRACREALARAGAPTRSATCWPATPAPTARSPPRGRRDWLGLGRRGGAATRCAGWSPSGRLVEGEFRRPSGGGHGAGVLRRRGAAPAAPPLAGRAAAEGRAGRRQPTSPASCRPWQGVGGSCAGADGVLRAVEQLAGRAGAGHRAGVAGPAGPGARLPPGMLDELTTAGRGALAGPRLAGRRRRLGVAAPRRPRAAHPRRAATPVTDDLAVRVLRGARGRRLLLPRARPTSCSADDAELGRALWDLVWAGRLTNDTLAPLRVLLQGRPAHRSTPAAPARGRYGRALPRAPLPRRGGPPETAGRWSPLPAAETDATTPCAWPGPSCCSTATAS